MNIADHMVYIRALSSVKGDMIVVQDVFKYKYAYQMNNKQVLVYCPFIHPAKDIRLYDFFPYEDIWLSGDELLLNHRDGNIQNVKLLKEAVQYIQREGQRDLEKYDSQQ